MRRPTVPRRRNKPEQQPDLAAPCQVSNVGPFGSIHGCTGKATHLLVAGRSVLGVCCVHQALIGAALPKGWMFW